jgi:arylsulfatase A-like enzyme
MADAPDVVLLLCDTARADAFRPWGGSDPSPNLERLCREGLVYTAATAAAPWTVPSIASIFAGCLPTEHGVSGEGFQWVEGRPTSQAPTIQNYMGSWLPESMDLRGYRTRAASCNAWVSRWGGFDRGFDEFVQLSEFGDQSGRPSATWARRAERLYGKVDKGGRAAVEHLGRWLKEAHDAPVFAFVDLMEMHDPYDPPRPFYPFAFWKRHHTRVLSGGSEASRQIRRAFEFGDPPVEYVRAVRELYRAAAAYEDWLLGRFVRTIEDAGRPCVVVVVSDHGENLGERGQFKHNSSLAQTLLHVPLVIWGHRVDLGRGVVEEPVSLVALPDWIQDLDEVRDRPLAGGGAVISEYESAIRHTGIGEWVTEVLEERGAPVPALVRHPGIAIRQGTLKYVAALNGDEALYDLAADPGEDHDVLAWKPEAARDFAELKDAWVERWSREGSANDPGALASDEIADHLRSLGYID